MAGLVTIAHWVRGASRRGVVIFWAALLVAGVGGRPRVAAAQVAGIATTGPVVGKSLRVVWARDATAFWYCVLVADANGVPKIGQWVLPSEVECAASVSTCAARLPTDGSAPGYSNPNGAYHNALAEGEVTWWVLTLGPQGAVWSAPVHFTYAFSTSTGDNNTASGGYALFNNTTGTFNTATGGSALFTNTTGAFNTASGSYALANNTTGNFDTANGVNALASNITGQLNTASGMDALQSNTTGDDNTASGSYALQSNTAGVANTASGMNALQSNTTGDDNTASGSYALQSNTIGVNNTASGSLALRSSTTSFGNTASGYAALLSNTTGSRNVAVGVEAGDLATTGSDNIYLGAGVEGVAGESKTMYLGRQGTQTKTVIAGIRGSTTGVANAIPVVIDSNGQLGTVSSSVRFKEDIHDMGAASHAVFGLRPVTFRYKAPYRDGTKPLQYGLVAEEVAEVFPDLAVRDAEGRVETVHYETLSVLLLNEVQQQQTEIEKQQAEMRQQRTRIEQQQTEMQQQARRVEALERRLDQVLAKSK